MIVLLDHLLLGFTVTPNNCANSCENIFYLGTHAGMPVTRTLFLDSFFQQLFSTVSCKCQWSTVLRHFWCKFFSATFFPCDLLSLLCWSVMFASLLLQFVFPFDSLWTTAKFLSSSFTFSTTFDTLRTKSLNSHLNECWTRLHCTTLKAQTHTENDSRM